jgi:hypothetical protein
LQAKNMIIFYVKRVTLEDVLQNGIMHFVIYATCYHLQLQLVVFTSLPLVLCTIWNTIDCN